MSVRPLEAVIGGLLIGTACGVYMLFSGRIAGNSGALKAMVLGPREPTKVAFTGGLLSGGAIMKLLLPSSFSAPPPPSLVLGLAGLATGIGTALSNGCTSGHGLCGLSRLSLRSLAAVPTFMLAALVTATANSGGVIGAVLPVEATPATTVALAMQLAGGLVLALVAGLVVLPAKSTVKDAYLGLWCGGCFAVGLALGGMVRPSVVTGALSPAAFDGTLWILFCTALATTFVAYRVAARVGVRAASAWDAASPGGVDGALLLGSALFGVGWGASGLCPGPLLVGLAAAPGAPGPLLVLMTVTLGMTLARPLGRSTGLLPHDPAAELADETEVKAAMYQLAATGDVTLVDLRPLATEEETGAPKRFETIMGALSAPWDGASGTIPTKALPKDKRRQLVLYCRTGRRAKLAAAFLKGEGYTNLINAGGPAGPPPLWAALGFGRRHHSHSLGVFEQLFDGPPPAGGGSSTYTYLLGDMASGEAILIDPVLEQVERDLARITQLGLRLTLAINTHCHADHITGTGALKRKLPQLVSIISRASGARADRHVAPGELIEWANGQRVLRVLGTPGHTNGCISFFDDTLGAVFTGDALLISGCGRTDFQEGSAATLWESVTRQLFTLPDTTLVLPAHDYSGRRFSTIKHERDANPRFSLGRDGFLEHMANLGLPYPKKIDVALPANLMCGLD